VCIYAGGKAAFRQKNGNRKVTGFKVETDWRTSRCEKSTKQEEEESGKKPAVVQYARYSDNFEKGRGKKDRSTREGVGRGHLISGKSKREEEKKKSPLIRHSI